MVLSTFAKIAFFPVWILWKGYTGLWWAFDDVPSPRKVPGAAGVAGAAAVAGGPAQDTSFQVIDSMPRAEARPKPLLALRLGFAASLIGSAMLGAITGGISEAGHLTPQHAAMAWAWGSLALFVGSVWSIARARRVPKAEKRAASRRGFVAGAEPAAAKVEGTSAAAASVDGSAWRARCVKAKSAARTAGTLAANTCKGAAQTCKTAAKIAKPGVKFAWSSAKSAWKKAAEESKKA